MMTNVKQTNISGDNINAIGNIHVNRIVLNFNVPGEDMHRIKEILLWLEDSFPCSSNRLVVNVLPEIENHL